MAAPSLKQIFDNNRYQLKYAATQSQAWFNQQAILLKQQGITSRRLLKDNDELKWVERIMPGKLYYYMYIPKHKATLPYYDQFPMVFPFRAVKDGFIGLNMHYIPYDYRVKILDKLIDIDLSKNTNNKKLHLSWDLISGSSKLKPLEPCVHHYLYGHITSGLKLIYPKDYATAMMLPVQQFVGASTTAVWKDSRRKGGF